MNMKVFNKQIEEEYERADKLNKSDLQMMLQDARTKERREKKRKEVMNAKKVSADQRISRVEENRSIEKEHQREKITELKQSREVKDAYILNQKSQKIIPKTYTTHMKEIEEDNEEIRNKTNKEILSKLQLYSHKHNNHIEQIKTKFYKYNQNVVNKHHQYWEERKIDKNDKKNEIDLVNAKKYQTYQKYIFDKTKQVEHYHDRLEQKILMASKNRNELNSPKEEELIKMVERIREGGRIEDSIELIPRRGHSHKNDKTTKQKYDERQIMIQKQYENKMKLNNDKIIKNEKILLEEFELFQKVNEDEQKKENERQRNKNNIILIQEEKEKRINDLNNKLNKLKNESIYKKNVLH